MSIIGYDESERWEAEPARYFVQVTKREKRACRCCEQASVTMAPLEPRIVEKGMASDSVVIATVVSKYCDHQPLYRYSSPWDSPTRRHGRAQQSLDNQVVTSLQEDFLVAGVSFASDQHDVCDTALCTFHSGLPIATSAEAKFVFPNYIALSPISALPWDIMTVGQTGKTRNVLLRATPGRLRSKHARPVER